MIKSSHGLLESDEKRNFVNGSDRTEAQKKWRVISKVITFYVNLGLQNCEKVRNYRKSRHNSRIYTRDGLSVQIDKISQTTDSSDLGTNSWGEFRRVLGFDYREKIGTSLLKSKLDKTHFRFRLDVN